MSVSLDVKLKEKKKVIITGGLGFIGGNLIRRLLNDSNYIIYNIDKIGYASDKNSINDIINNSQKNLNKRYIFLQKDLLNQEDLIKTINIIEPDLIMHFAAESHVDRSISSPKIFIQSNIIGTFNLLEAIRIYYENLKDNKKQSFRFHHISTDEVFGELGASGRFDENTAYRPRSPYSASKASSDHLVKAWWHTYNIPIVISNCSNNYGPYQYPEKLIPLAILNSIKGKKIPLYGDGLNIRDWLYIDDHIDALLLIATHGDLGESYCIGGFGEISNKELLIKICKTLDKIIPSAFSYINQIEEVPDRKGHDFRYAINPNKIINKLGWEPKVEFNDGLLKTIKWYLANIEWCNEIVSNK